jgi:hypothetical protein
MKIDKKDSEKIRKTMRVDISMNCQYSYLI